MAIFNEKLQFSFHKPYNIQLSWYHAVIDVFIKYGFYKVSDFWESYEQLLCMLYEYGDFETLEKVGSKNLNRFEILNEQDIIGELQEINEEDLVAKANQRLSSIPVSVMHSNFDIDQAALCQEITCGEFGFTLNIPCTQTQCSYYSRHSVDTYNCGYDAKDPGMRSFEVIAEKLNIPLKEVHRIYAGAINQLQNNTFILSNLLDPLWDLVIMEDRCSVCCADIEDDFKSREYNEHVICGQCIVECSLQGAKLIIRFRCPLRDIIDHTSRHFKNFQAQASSLGITVSILQNLYNRTGINRRSSQAAGRAYFLTYSRPGKPIINYNSEHLAMEALSFQKIFGNYSPEITSDLHDLSNTLEKMGVVHESPFTEYLIKKSS